MFNNKEIKTFELGNPISPNDCIKLVSDHDSEHSVLDLLKELITKPEIKQIDSLIIGEWQDAYDVSCQDIIDFIIENKEYFSGLKHFFSGDMDSEECEMSWINQMNYEKFLATFSDLETLSLQGGMGLELGKVSLPKLKSLNIYTGGLSHEVLESIANAKPSLANLEHLEIWLGTEEYEGSVEAKHVKNLLAGEGFPKLKYLGLMNSDIQDEVIEQLAGHPILKQLDVLDISMGVLTNKGGETLLNEDSFLSPKAINCAHHFMSTDMMTKLSEGFSNIDVSDQQDDEDDWTYVQVGE